MTSEGTDSVEGRRNTDMTSAIAIAELRVEMRALTQTVKDSYTMLNDSIRVVKLEQADNRTMYTSVQSEVRTEVRIALSEVKRDILDDMKEHTHNDLAPHQGTLGRRVGSLETSRTYTKGIFAVGALVMPFASAFIFKWIAG